MKLPVSFHIENRWKWVEHNSVSIDYYKNMEVCKESKNEKE